MNIIKLEELELKILTELDITDYCNLNDINPDNITELNLKYNDLTDISGIKLFKNLERLWLDYNKITDISCIKNFKNLINLSIDYLRLESDQIEYIKSLKSLKNLFRIKGFKDMSVLNQLNKNIELY